MTDELTPLEADFAATGFLFFAASPDAYQGFGAASDAALGLPIGEDGQTRTVASLPPLSECRLAPDRRVLVSLRPEQIPDLVRPQLDAAISAGQVEQFLSADWHALLPPAPEGDL